MTGSWDGCRRSSTATIGSGVEKLLYIRGNRGVNVKQGGNDSIADNLGIDWKRRRWRPK